MRCVCLLLRYDQDNSCWWNVFQIHLHWNLIYVFFPCRLEASNLTALINFTLLLGWRFLGSASGCFSINSVWDVRLPNYQCIRKHDRQKQEATGEWHACVSCFKSMHRCDYTVISFFSLSFFLFFSFFLYLFFSFFFFFFNTMFVTIFDFPYLGFRHLSKSSPHLPVQEIIYSVIPNAEPILTEAFMIL